MNAGENERDEIEKAKDIALRLLKIRNRSEKEITDRLARKNVHPHVISKTVEFLKSTRLIDDRQFTKTWIDARLKKPFGIHRISFELKEKGINNDLIEEGLSFFTQNYPEDEIVLALAKKRLSKYKNLDNDVIKHRLFGYLVRRGFSSEAINKTITQLCREKF